MKSGNVLIITHSNDNECIDRVSEFLRAKGANVIRFNVDEYPLKVRLTSVYREGTILRVLITKEQTYQLNEIGAVWYRRAYGIGSGLEELMDPTFVAPTKGELRHTVLGMVEGLSCFVLSRPSLYRRLDSKELQLREAVRAGLRIPLTCVTNDPEEARSFIHATGFPLIVKMQSSFAILQGGEDAVVYTSILSEEHLQTIESLSFCPMMIQQAIAKAYELRITVVGKHVFAFKVNSQSEAEGQTDWRRAGKKLAAQWTPYALPAAIHDRLIQLMQQLDLLYGAIDIICTPDGEYYFLEVNAAGEYFWLDRLVDYTISEKIAELLLEQGKTGC